MFYILTENHEIQSIPDAKAWAEWTSVDNVRVGRTNIGKARVSTVFLGLDHNFSGEGHPVLFETMVFGESPLADEQERYCTWDEAVAGHAAMVKRVKEAQDA